MAQRQAAEARPQVFAELREARELRGEAARAADEAMAFRQEASLECEAQRRHNVAMRQQSVQECEAQQREVYEQRDACRQEVLFSFPSASPLGRELPGLGTSRSVGGIPGEDIGMIEQMQHLLNEEMRACRAVARERDSLRRELQDLSRLARPQPFAVSPVRAARSRTRR
mmetsp:Transcript_33463/g.99696  ORF Transcript_33463/g.99696 Transcript_33463/m.99696 type:complete len:170 (-) Transcript_33463:86-595(-)